MKKVLLWMAGAISTIAISAIFIPTASAAMLDDFEDGLQGGSTVDGAESDGWYFYPDEGDAGAISIDSTQGANGTDSSLRVDVTEGDIYLYWLVAERGVAIPEAAGANRMRFFIKFDENFPVNDQEWPWHQLEVGTFMADDSTGLHYYHFFNREISDDGWQEVILTNSPSLQRDVNGQDVGVIDDYYDRYERFYIQGTPENSNMAEPVRPYTVWIDEVEFYYEDEYEACTTTGQYEFDGLTCPEDLVCTGALVGGCCIQGGCVEGRELAGNENEENEEEDNEGDSDLEMYPFVDTKGHWAEDYILELYEMNIVEGRSEGVFDPNGTINRAEIVKIITLLFDIDVPDPEDVEDDPCPDVDQNMWYAPYFQAAVDNGIVEGYPDGTCGPGNDVTRVEATKMFLEAAGAMEGVPEDSNNWLGVFGLDEVPFWDMDDDQWYTPYVLVGYDAGVITGYNDESVRPGISMTRAEVSKVALISFEDATEYVFVGNVECTEDSDCDDGEVCTENLCEEAAAEEPEEVPCDTDADCEDLQICSDESLCIDVECTLDEHCAEGQQCLNYECDGEIEVLQCVENDDCRMGWFCAEDSQCLPECRSDEDCPENEGCSFLGCVVIAADDPTDIEAECNVNGVNCPDGEICSGYICVDPENDPDYECAEDVDCSEGEVCNYNQCAPALEEEEEEEQLDGNFNALNYSMINSWGGNQVELGILPGDGEFYKPRAVAIDNENGWLYVTDADDEEDVMGRVQKFDLDGNFLLSWGEWGTLAGQFDSPQGVAVDSSGDVFVADRDNNRIQKFDSDGNYIISFGTTELNQPRNVHVDADDYVYVASSENTKVYRYDNDGTNPVEVADDYDFDRPTGVSTDSDLNVYVADATANTIVKISPEGVILNEWQAAFNNSYNVTVDPNGNIWVADEWSNLVRKFDANFASEMVQIDGLSLPHGVAVADNGNIYVADEGNSEIKVYEPL